VNPFKTRTEKQHLSLPVILKMKSLYINIFIFLTLGTAGCNGLKFMIGKKEISEERNSEGELVKKILIKKRSTRIFHHPHNPSIRKTKTWNFQNGKLIEFTLEKRRRTMMDWEGKVLKYKIKNWSTDGKRIK
jgi:hypothetical protein